MKSFETSTWKGPLAWISLILLAFFLQSGLTQRHGNGPVSMFVDGPDNQMTMTLTAQKRDSAREPYHGPVGQLKI